MDEDDVQKRLQDLADHLWREKHEAELERVRADPAANRLTMQFEGSLNYRYWTAGQDARGREVRFCWSTKRNVAGYFLGWREVISSDGSDKRDQWSARKVKKRLTELAQRRAAAFKAKRKV